MEYLQGHIPGAISFDIGGLNAKTSEAGLKILQEFYGAKSRATQEKFFWKNSIKVYKWVRRAPNQPQLT